MLTSKCLLEGPALMAMSVLALSLALASELLPLAQHQSPAAEGPHSVVSSWGEGRGDLPFSLRGRLKEEALPKPAVPGWPIGGSSRMWATTVSEWHQCTWGLAELRPGMG